MTTSCRSWRARRAGREPKREGLSDPPEVVLTRSQAGPREQDGRAFQGRGGREGVELGADPGLPAGGGKLADKDEAPKG